MVRPLLRNRYWSTLCAIILIVASWAFIFWDCLILEPLLSRDDLSIINEIRKTAGPSLYFSKFLNGDYSDIQPVRDISFFLNVFLERSVGYGGYHLFNILLAAAILIVLKKLLTQYVKSDFFLNLIIVILALHPSLNVVMAWTSNRKHLLSVLFILLYYDNWLRSHGHNRKNVFLYTLSIFSQPITLFFPLVLMADKTSYRRNLPADVCAILILVFCLGVNFYFYEYDPHFYARNTFPSSFFKFDWILHLGRLVSQIFLPVIFAVEYDPGSLYSLIGLVMIVLLGIWLYSLGRLKKLSYPLLFLVLSTLYPTIRLGIYRDPYGLIALLVCLPVLFIELNKRFGKILEYLMVALIPLFIYQSYISVDIWENDFKLFGESAQREGGALNYVNFAFLNKRFNPDLAYRLSLEIRKQYPHGMSYHFMLLIAESFYYTSLKSKEEKLKIYLSTEGSGEFHLFFKYKFLTENGNSEEAQKAARLLWKELKETPNAFESFSSTICHFYKADCENLGFLGQGGHRSSLENTF